MIDEKINELCLYATFKKKKCVANIKRSHTLPLNLDWNTYNKFNQELPTKWWIYHHVHNKYIQVKLNYTVHTVWLNKNDIA